MEPMFLREVEQNSQPGGYGNDIDMMSGAEYPRMGRLFAFRPNAAEHLARFTQEILRGPATMHFSTKPIVRAASPLRSADTPMDTCANGDR